MLFWKGPPPSPQKSPQQQHWWLKDKESTFHWFPVHWRRAAKFINRYSECMMLWKGIISPVKKSVVERDGGGGCFGGRGGPSGVQSRNYYFLWGGEPYLFLNSSADIMSVWCYKKVSSALLRNLLMGGGCGVGRGGPFRGTEQELSFFEGWMKMSTDLLAPV